MHTQNPEWFLKKLDCFPGKPRLLFQRTTFHEPEKLPDCEDADLIFFLQNFVHATCLMNVIISACTFNLPGQAQGKM